MLCPTRLSSPGAAAAGSASSMRISSRCGAGRALPRPLPNKGRRNEIGLAPVPRLLHRLADLADEFDRVDEVLRMFLALGFEIVRAFDRLALRLRYGRK